MRELKKIEMSDVSVGAGLLGAGGGGAVSEGLKMVDRVLKFGDAVQLADIEEIAELIGGRSGGVGLALGRRMNLRRTVTNLTWRLQAQPPSLLVGEYVGKLRKVAARQGQTEELARAKVEGLTVPLRLVMAGGPRPPVRACRVPLAQAEWLKKLVYLLPPQVLEGYSVCSTADSIFLYNETEVEFIPLGNLFYQVAMGILVPVGYELQPRVHPDVLVQHLGGGRENLLFFRLDDPMPVQLPRSAFGPLTRQALAHVELQPLQPVAGGDAYPAAARGSNDPVGTFPLWGFTPRAPRSGDDGEGEA